MNEFERQFGPATPMRVEALEDRNAPTSFGSWSFGGCAAHHPPPPPAHTQHWTPPSHSFGWGHGHCNGHHQPPAAPPPAQTGTVSGVVFRDDSFDGVRDAGEPGLGGLFVWADENGDGVWQSTEASATTAADGSYTLTGVTAGVQVTVMTTTNNGAASTPATAVAPPGGTVTGADIAVRPGTSS